MGERTNDSAYRGNERDLYKLELVGLGAPGDRPNVAVLAVGARNEVLHTQEVGEDGNFTLPAEVLKQAQRVVVGASDDKGGVHADAAITYRADEFRAQLQNGTLALAEGTWLRFRFHWVCVSGSVQACKRRPWWYESIVTAATTLARASSVTASALSAPFALATNRASLSTASATLPSRLVPSINDLIAWPFRCAPVCRGSVEVYRRTCCCWPIVFADPRITDLIRDLEVYVQQLPKLPPPKRFPPPPPPPVDPLKTPFFEGGALNELALNAATDLQALRAMPADQAAAYINGRAYLLHRLCHCSQPVRVGTGTLQPDGSFNICWLEPWRLLLPNCYEQYAYVVKQTVGLSTRTIYNGLTAGAWHAAGEHPVLTSYDPLAYTCNETGPGDGSAYVFLDEIGATESHELITPAATGWDRVAAPDDTSGLLFPNVGPGPFFNHRRNLGGGIELTFIFSLGLRDAAIGAHYYRISVCRADALGNPTGARSYYGDGLAWQKVVGADIVPESLGPVTVGTQANLYRIPYSDEAWVGSGRYHAMIDSTKAEFNLPIATDLASPAVHHLVTLEVFDAAGNRLRPLGAPASGQPGTEDAKAFEYRRWFQPGGSVGDDTSPVPFAALTHLFCWDNRVPVADITRLVMNGSASDEECQFLDGPGDSTFAVEYRAYVPDQRFQYAHGISWLRGLNASAANGGIGSLPTPASPGNVGKPPAGPIDSGSNTFAQMLTRLDPPNPPTVLPRCSFAVTLTTYAKTTNGANMNYPFAQETAAFALAID